MIHLIAYHYAGRFRCGTKVEDLVDRENDWSAFNSIRTTSPKEATCRDCLEWALQQKRKEAKEIEDRLWEATK